MKTRITIYLNKTIIMKTVAIMISWGLDSYIMYYYAKKQGYKPIPIRVDLGQPYAEKELEAINSFEFADEIIKLSIKDFVSKIPANVDKKNQIIPWRNLLLWVLWANWWEEVRIGALYWEEHWKERDKSKPFFKMTTELLTYIFNIVRPYTEMKTPFSHLTKTWVVKRALDNGITAEQLAKTTTCYDEHDHNCGNCSTCFKRRMALSLNGINEEFKTNPLESDYCKEMIEEIRSGNKNGRLIPERVEEIKQALHNVWIEV